MALNLSTLTSPATSGDVLQEATTTADFLESCPVLRNLSRGSNKGGDAKQGTATNQPKALPLIDGDGYLYLSGVSGNHASIPNESSFNLGTQLEIRCKVTCKNWTPGTNQLLVAKSSSYSTSLTSFYLELSSNGKLSIIYNDGSNVDFAPSTVVTGISDGSTKWIKATLNTNQSGSAVINYYLSDDNISYTQLGATVTKTARGDIHDTVHPITIGHGTNNFGGVLLGAVHQVQIFASNNGTSKILDVDFTAKKIRHNDTKFVCGSGQVVTINQSGNDPATIIKKPVLRFAGTNSAIGGLLNQTIDSGYFFAAFSVLGNGGESTCRVFAINSTGQAGHDSTGFIVSARLSTDEIASYYAGWKTQHDGMFDDANGDILHEIKFQAGAQRSRANNADERNRTDTMDQISAEEYTIAAASLAGADSANIDLEYLALFPATITDAQAADVVNYINNRNNVFDLKDGFGYYFFDPQSITDSDLSGATNRLTGSWEGRIVGSDNGDTSRSAYNGTEDDQPTSDKYTLTFADNTDNLSFSISQAGWQVVGTSLGTFAYKVNSNAVTALSLLGNRGGYAAFQPSGDLYGAILLPVSATGADIEAARKLLIDRGAADSLQSGSVFGWWLQRSDVVEIKNIDFSSVTQMGAAFKQTSISKFDNIDLSSCSSFSETWRTCQQLSSFSAIDAKNGTSFANAWNQCSALTSFPSGAKLGTAVSSGVNFTDAWASSGLTSFNTPLPTSGSVRQAWYNCQSLQSFSTELPTATRVDFTWYNNTSLSDFKTTDIKNCTNFQGAWRNCSALTSFPAGAQLGTEAANVDFSGAWQSSGLTSFSTPLPTATNLGAAFRYCTPLVSFTLDELPLVTSVSTTWHNTRFQSFSTKLPKVTTCYAAWYYNTALTDFSADVFANWNPSSITSGVFNLTWTGCTALTAQSVENILTSIDASGKHATTTGASGGSALADAGIDIDYDGTTLSAATDSAITSLRGKSWVVYINGVERIP